MKIVRDIAAAALASLVLACGAARARSSADRAPLSDESVADLPACPADGSIAVPARTLDHVTPQELRARLASLHAVDSATFVIFDRAPGVRNTREVSRLLEANYPPELRDRGIGGTTIMSFLVDADGRVASVRVDHSSGQTAIDMAAYAVAGGISFWPAVHQGCRVPSLVGIPIAFRVVERGP